VCGAAQCLCVWPDANQPFRRLQQPLLAGHATALAAAALAAGQGVADGVLAVVGFRDGSMQRLEMVAGRGDISSSMLPTGDSRKKGRGVINMLSSAVKAAYVDTFYPAVGSQAACSGAGVVALHLSAPLPGATGPPQRELLVLTRDSLEQWKLVPLAHASEGVKTERCEASHDLLSMLRSSLGVKLVEPLQMALPEGQHSQVVLLASGAPPTSRTIATPELRYALLTVALSSARQPTVQRCATLPECAVREDAAVLAEREEQRRAAWAPGSLDAHQLVASRSHPGALLMQQPGGGLWLLGEGGTPKVMEAVRVGSAAATLGSGVSVDGGTWLFLNAAQGVLAIRIVSSVSQGAPGTPEAARHSALGPEQQAKVFAELDSALMQIGAGRGPGPLGYTLHKLGAFQPDGAQNPIAMYSTELIDMLPKHWGLPGGSAGALSASAVSIGEQLEEKLQRHCALVDLLEAGDCMGRLRAASLHIIFENAEKAGALYAIRQFENGQPHRLNAEQAATLTAYGERCGWAESGAGAQSSDSRSAVAQRVGVTLERLDAFLSSRGAQPLHEAIEAAGRAIQDRTPILAKRFAWEVFYARASEAVPLLFGAMGTVMNSSLRLTHQKACLAAAKELLHAGEAALLHAAYSREDLQRRFPASTALVKGGCEAMPWSCGSAVRLGLTALLDCSLDRRPPLSAQRNREHVVEVRALLHQVAEQLLGACAAALAAHRGAAPPAALQREYDSCKEQALGALLEEAKWEAESTNAAYGNVPLMREVERLAEAHCSYAQLVGICELLQDEPRLHYYMAAVGPPGEFPRFVMERLHGAGRDVELLNLPAQFDHDMLAFLEPLPSMQWLHHLRMQRHGDAAATLSHIAEQTSADLKRTRKALALERLCQLATATPGLTGRLSQDAADAAARACSQLVLLGIQEEIGKQDAAPMGPGELVGAALEAGEAEAGALVAAVAVFAAAGGDFIRANQERLKKTWVKVVLASDWDEVGSKQRQMSDLEWGMELDAVPLVQAVRRARSVGAADADMSAAELQAWLSGDIGLSVAGREAALIALDYALNFGPTQPVELLGDAVDMQEQYAGLGRASASPQPMEA